MKSLERQVGGTHYMTMALQPNEFAMANGWDAAAYAILKYVSRHQGKNGFEDLSKAHHYVAIRQDLQQPAWQKTGYVIHNGVLCAPLGTHTVYNDRRVSMDAYIHANMIPNLEARVLQVLDKWVAEGELSQLNFTLESQISFLAYQTYGKVI